MSAKNRGFSFLDDYEDEEDFKDTSTVSPFNPYEFDETEPIKFLEGEAESKKVVISLDFGSTHSGFSYALTSDKEIKCYKKTNGLYKEPTCALFEKTGELVAFGMKAREKYLTKLASSNMLAYTASFNEDYSSDYLYFDYNKLKMRLYGNHGREKLYEIKVRSANGTEVKMGKLVMAILTQLKVLALDEISEKEGIKDLKATDCLWVLTVPAIWLEIDKQFMRTAAVEAEIIPDFHSPNLILALEPECAAIRLYTLRGLEIKVGEKFLVLDCGGGTVDYCAIEVSSSPAKQFRFRQLCEPTGGNWGSVYIDENFFKILKRLFGKDAYTRGMLISAASNDIHTGWETLKLRLRARHFQEGNRGVSIELKNLLTETKQKLPKLVSKYNSVHKHQLKYKKRRFGSSTKLQLTPKILRTIFDPIIRKVVKHTKYLFKRPELKGLKNLILVGGFGQCDYLKFQIKRELQLGDGVIIVPKESSSVVMTGAVNFGLQPSVIESRKCALSVGVKSRLPFDEKVHVTEDDIAHKKYDKKKKTYYLRDVFVPLVRKGQEVTVNEEVSQTYQASPKQSSIKFDIYASRKPDIKYVDDNYCIRLGKIIISVDKTVKKVQKFKITLKIGFTELFATVKNLTTDKETNIRVEFDKLGNKAIVIDEATPKT